MEQASAKFLVSERGDEAIAEALALVTAKVDPLTGITRLRKMMNADEARAAWAAASVQQKSVDKLGAFSRLVLDQEGYEMASGAVASRYHAQLLAETGAHHVIDLCAGLGLDSIAFAQAGLRVTSFEFDPGRAVLLAENVHRAGVANMVDVKAEDVTTATLPKADAAFFDPARRSGSRRWAKGEHQTTPPLSFIESVRANDIQTILAKLSPAVDRTIRETYGGDLSFVSVKGECKEALLLTGNVTGTTGLRAVLLPDGQTFSSRENGQLSDSLGPYIWEPDPAVIRAGLTSALANSLGGSQCDPQVDYFFTTHAGASPFAVCYKVLTQFVYSRRALADALVGSGKVILKQRNFPQSIDEIYGKLKLNGSKTSTVILTTLNSSHLVFVVERLALGGAL